MSGRTEVGLGRLTGNLADAHLFFTHQLGSFELSRQEITEIPSDDLHAPRDAVRALEHPSSPNGLPTSSASPLI